MTNTATNKIRWTKARSINSVLAKRRKRIERAESAAAEVVAEYEQQAKVGNLTADERG